MDYYSFCQDEAIKVKMVGAPIHQFFDPKEFLEFGLHRMNGELALRDLIVDLPIDAFLGLAEPIPDDDENRHGDFQRDLEDFRAGIRDNRDYKWTLPLLVIEPNEDGIWKVSGHDGRHRAKLLKEVGFRKMPVHFHIPRGNIVPASEMDVLPEILWCQNDKNVIRDRDYYPFPIEIMDIERPYCEIANGEVFCKGLDTMTIVQDEKPSEGGNEGVGMAPVWCRRAKKNFKRNYVKNFAYRKDYTMPANTLKEYFAKHRH